MLSQYSRQNALVPAEHQSAVYSGYPSTNEDELNFERFWQILQKRRWIVLRCAAAGLLLALAVSFIMKRRFEAVAQIEVNKEQSDMLGRAEPGATPSGSTDSLDYNIQLQTEAQVLESDSLALQVIDQLKLEQQADYRTRYSIFTPSDLAAERSLPLQQATQRRYLVLKRFHRNVKVKSIAGTRLIEVHVLDRDPAVAAQIANKLVSDYIEQYYRLRFEATQQASDWLSSQLDDLKHQVETSSQRLADYQKATGILGVDEANNVILAKLEELNKQVTTAQANRILKESVYRLTQSKDPETISSLVGSGMIDIATGIGATSTNTLTLVSSLRAQEAALKTQLADARIKYGPEYPRVLQLQQQLAQVNASIASEVNRIAQRAENDYLAAKFSEDMLRASFEQQKAETNKFNDAAIQFTILKKDAEAESTLYQDLTGKLRAAGILAGLRSTNINVIDPARPGARAARPIFSLNLGAGAMLGLFLGTGLAFFFESRDNTVTSLRMAESIAHAPALGFIPAFAPATVGFYGRRKEDKAALPAGPLASINPGSQVAESYRSLRTALLLSTPDASPRTILVTSGMEGDGKSTTCLNTATVLVQQGARTLLLDADMRTTRVLGPSGHPGLSNLLTGTATLDEAIYEHPHVPGLSCIGAGARPPNPAELIGSQAMERLLLELRGRFDHIVIDSPPMLAVTDAVVLSSKVDEVILIARSGVTTRQSLARASDLLKQVGARSVGVLLNGFDVTSADHRYNYGKFSSYYGGPHNEPA